MLFSNTTKILGGTAALGLASVPVTQYTYSAADDQDTRQVGKVETSKTGVGGKKELKKPASARTAPVPAPPAYRPPPPPAATYTPAPPLPAPTPAPAAPAAAAVKKGGSEWIFAAVAAAAVIGGILAIGGDDDDAPVSP